MKLRKVDAVILLLLGLLCIARGTWGLVKDIYIDLSNAKSVTGKVIYADTVLIEKLTFKRKKFSTVFTIKLENSAQNFTVDRGVDFSNYLKSNIKIADTIQLLYRLSTSEHNSFVFQVEKDQHVLASFKNYKKREIRMIILGYAFGLLILGGLFVRHLKRRKQII